MAWRLQRFPVLLPMIALAGRGAAIVLALIVAGVVLGLSGADPFTLGRTVLRATFGSKFGLQDFGLWRRP